MAVFVEREWERLETLLVPYGANIHDDLALELALRLVIDSDSRRLTVMRLVQEGFRQGESSYEFRTVMDQLSDSVRDRIDIQLVEAPDSALQTVVEASAAFDLTIAGTSRAWGIERQTLGRYTDQLAVQCRSSLLITRRYSQVTSHLASVVGDTGRESTTDTDKTGVEI